MIDNIIRISMSMLSLDNILPTLYFAINIFILHFSSDLKITFKKSLFYYLLTVIAWNIIEQISIAIIGQKIALFYIFIIPMLLMYKASFYQSVFLMFTLINVYSSIISIIAIAIQGFFEYGSHAHKLAYLLISLIPIGLYAAISVKYLRPICKNIFAATEKKMWKLYAFGQMVGFIALNAVSFEAVEAIPPYISNPWVQGLLVILVNWSFFMLVIGIVTTHQNAENKYELELAKQTISSSKDYYEHLTSSVETLRILRHDYKYHTAVLLKLINSDNKEEAQEYLKKVNQSLVSAETVVYCDNQIINALITYYEEAYKGVNITFDVKIVLSKDNVVDDYEFCVVIGNLLQNALEACEKITNSERKVELYIKGSDDQVVIMVKNSMLVKPLQNEANQITSIKEVGGYGMRSVRTVVDKYRGEYISEWTDKDFTAIAMLNI